MLYTVTLGGKNYEIEVVEGEALLVDVSAASAPAAAAHTTSPAVASAPTAPVVVAGGETVTAPIPGTVLSIKVQAGQSVKAGTVLLVVEAMKMENEIMAPHDCTIKQVIAAQGAAVDAGAPLLVIG